MDVGYSEAVALIQNTKIRLEKILIRANKSYEDKRSFILIQKLFSDIEDTLENYSSPIKEGYLIQNSSGQFEIEFINGGGSYPLCSGKDIEILITVDGWMMGRVEYTIMHNKGYYFYNEELKHPALYSGMKTRIRLNNSKKTFLNENVG